MAESRTRSHDDRRRGAGRSDDPNDRDDAKDPRGGKGRSDGKDRSDRRDTKRDRDAKGPSDGNRDGNRSLDAREVARQAMEQVVELTGREADAVTALEPIEDGWRVGVEIVETRRIPDSADILATYEVELDKAGQLVGYRRIRRYPRSHVDRDGR